mmetsp:Transcript_10656/g.25610  ORF Transcript_10656/g.25610 Transcript_10656/m.25610 type:complete len:218 (-) Transcript_10656:309-962(-)
MLCRCQGGASSILHRCRVGRFSQLFHRRVHREVPRDHPSASGLAGGHSAYRWWPAEQPHEALERAVCTSLPSQAIWSSVPHPKAEQRQQRLVADVVPAFRGYVEVQHPWRLARAPLPDALLLDRFGPLVAVRSWSPRTALPACYVSSVRVHAVEQQQRLSEEPFPSRDAREQRNEQRFLASPQLLPTQFRTLGLLGQALGQARGEARGEARGAHGQA